MWITTGVNTGLRVKGYVVEREDIQVWIITGVDAGLGFSDRFDTGLKLS